MINDPMRTMSHHVPILSPTGDTVDDGCPAQIRLSIREEEVIDNFRVYFGRIGGVTVPQCEIEVQNIDSKGKMISVTPTLLPNIPDDPPGGGAATHGPAYVTILVPAVVNGELHVATCLIEVRKP